MNTIVLLILLIILGSASLYIGYFFGRWSYQDELSSILEQYIREKDKERKDKGGEEDGTK